MSRRNETLPRRNETIQWCGATIISEKHLVTAAHCIQNLRFIIIGAPVLAGHIVNGKYDYSEECTRQTRKIIQVQGHPCYCGGFECEGPGAPEVAKLLSWGQYDVAILTVDPPFVFNEFVQPACLPESDAPIPVGTAVLTSGFGQVTYPNRTKPITLQSMTSYIMSQAKCNQTHGPYAPRLTDDMVCAGVPTGRISGCKGDSGGPMVVLAGKNGDRAVLHGVVSWGIDCGLGGMPSVYARVTEFLPWIHEMMTNPANESHDSLTQERCSRYLASLNKTETMTMTMTTIFWATTREEHPATSLQPTTMACVAGEGCSSATTMGMSIKDIAFVFLSAIFLLSRFG